MDTRRGFTLIELSIVLVIIGLIVGGVLVGQTLITAAKQRKLISVHEEFKTGWMVFRDKYKALPGDMLNATNVFGTAAACPTINYTSFTSGTCNGDGSRKIGWSGSYGEQTLVWHHLGYAGLIKQGTQPNFYYHSYFNESNVYSFLGSTSNTLAELYAGTGMVGNALQTSRYHTIADGAPLNQPIAAAFNPMYSQGIDQKIDDGFPLSGNFRTNNGMIFGTGVYATCHVLSSGIYIYDISNTEPACRLVYRVD